jgi:uncharacterized protein YqeY
MSELKDRLRLDLTAAMKAKDAVRRETLRMVLASITTAQVAGSAAKELTDTEVLAVLAKESKKRVESATVYEEAGRGELAAQERAELAVIEEYLPKQLGDEELGALVDKAIEQVTAELGERPAQRQMGQVMKAATALAQGQADGKRISEAVKARLG